MPATIDFRLDEESPSTRMAVVEIWFGGHFAVRICSKRTPAGAQEITIVTEHGMEMRQEDDGPIRQVLCTIDPAALKAAP